MNVKFSQSVRKVKSHIDEIENLQKSSRIKFMVRNRKPPYADQGRRLRLLRLAEGYSSGLQFCARMKWQSGGLSQFETGQRRISIDKVMQLRQTIPGFDAEWLWSGDKKNLSFDLRRRIEAEEAKEDPELGLMASY